jgi:prepilin-type N-terminal cleavage/methylation domain-containing protein
MNKILKRKNKKGFTLMEMLIVIGIIAVLVAIAIPTFSGAQKKAQYAADLANVRAWYAEQLVANMTEDKDLATVTSYTGAKLQMSNAKATPSVDTNGVFTVKYTWGTDDKGETKFPNATFPDKTTTPSSDDD